MCTWTGLTDRRHRQLAEEGWFRPPVKGFYELADVAKGLVRYFSEEAHKKGDSEAAARKRKLLLNGDKIEEELKIIRGEYVKTSDIGPALRNLSLQQRAVLQRKLEGEIGPKIANRSWEEIRPQMQGLVDELCGIMRDGTAAWLGEGEVSEKASKRVSGRKNARRDAGRNPRDAGATS